MKRYRVFGNDFDTRANILKLEIEDHWEDHIKEMWRNNKEGIKRGLLLQYGFENADEKLKNFVDLGPKPFSVLAYHNRFAEQARNAFVVGAYYPSLTGACALGERILNHLALGLRDNFKSTPEYKKVYKKKSFDNWDLLISTLEAWSVLVPKAVAAFKTLRDVRNRRAIHFDPTTDTKDREYALDAVRSLSEIVVEQFGTSAPAPWFIPGTKGGAGFIKKEMEADPFVKLVYLPNTVSVGPEHYLEKGEDDGWLVHDRDGYEDEEISDTEFVERFERATEARLAQMKKTQEEDAHGGES
ncbi:MAG: hypothetical protein ACFB50_14505 [Rubrobacteraceae bacterium]